MKIRNDWTMDELTALHEMPLFALLSKAHLVHSEFHRSGEIQVCNLISIKTGGCPEDCKYCAQSSRYKTSVDAQPMMTYEQVMQDASAAIHRGATRICLGAAWRQARDTKQFDEVLRMIKSITAMGAEVCCTLGMLTKELASKLKEAGLYAYNHNLDTSEKFYPQIITTRTYQDRINTLDLVDEAGLSLCCGGIFGLGEDSADRLELLHTLSCRNPHPESVPINRLTPIPGTPLGNRKEIPFWDVLRLIAVARIVMPRAMIRLSSGRQSMNYEQHALAFLAGANSIFMGEKLLTVANTGIDTDENMFTLLGLAKRPAFSNGENQ